MKRLLFALFFVAVVAAQDCSQLVDEWCALDDYKNFCKITTIAANSELVVLSELDGTSVNCQRQTCGDGGKYCSPDAKLYPVRQIYIYCSRSFYLCIKVQQYCSPAGSLLKTKCPFYVLLNCMQIYLVARTIHPNDVFEVRTFGDTAHTSLPMKNAPSGKERRIYN